MAMVLPMVPVGTKRAASLPAISAARCFEAVDGGVLAVDVVADLGLHHGAPHGGRGLGDGVAAQIDHVVRNSWKTSLESRTPRPVRRRTPSSRFEQAGVEKAADGLRRSAATLRASGGCRR